VAQAYAELVRMIKENPEYLALAVTWKDFNPPQVDSMMQMVRARPSAHTRAFIGLLT
jgi:hypothetical protein